MGRKLACNHPSPPFFQEEGKSMAKKSMIEREKKRQRLVSRYRQRRELLKSEIGQASSFDEKIALYARLQKLPRNSAPTRLHNRCCLTGRSKGFFRHFGLSRHMLRSMANQGLLPGVTKSSW